MNKFQNIINIFKDTQEAIIEKMTKNANNCHEISNYE